NAFCQAARLHMQLQNKLDSATSFVDAGNAYKKADPQGHCSLRAGSRLLQGRGVKQSICSFASLTLFFHGTINSITTSLDFVEHSRMSGQSVTRDTKLLEAHEEQNSEAFTEAVKEFDSVSRLDQWLTTMLLRIKKTIQGDAGDLK
ncbi:hypothetical protein GOODEAATRI_013651, partial [Goodea atripinnis]